jgi:hypothetical protein
LACGPGEAKVGDATLARADGVIVAADGPTVAIVAGKQAELPNAKVVRLAIDRDVPYRQVSTLLDSLRARGSHAVLLVGTRGGKIRAIEADPPGSGRGPVIRVVATPDGKACVALPEVIEAKCVKGTTGHIDRAFTRQLVREAMKASDLREAAVEASYDLGWGDVVRTVDGARTCCKSKKMSVSLAPFEG